VKRSEYLARWLGAGLGVVGGFLLGYFMVRGVGNPHPGYVIIGLTTLEGLIFAYLGTPYVLGGWRTFNFRLTSTPLPDLLSGLLGMVVGLVIAVLIGFFVRDLPYGYALSFVLALLLAAQGASVGLTRRAELTSLFFGGDRQAGGAGWKLGIQDHNESCGEAVIPPPPETWLQPDGTAVVVTILIGAVSSQLKTSPSSTISCPPFTVAGVKPRLSADSLSTGQVRTSGWVRWPRLVIRTFAAVVPSAAGRPAGSTSSARHMSVANSSTSPPGLLWPASPSAATNVSVTGTPKAAAILLSETRRRPGNSSCCKEKPICVMVVSACHPHPDVLSPALFCKVASLASRE